MELEKIKDSEQALMELIQNKRFLDLERVPLICNDIANIRKMMEAQSKQLDNLVTQDQFWPVKTLVYGFVGLALIGVIGALMALILKK